MTDDQYEAVAFCANCGYEGSVLSPVGEPVFSSPCPLCACKMLRPVALREWERGTHE